MESSRIEQGARLQQLIKALKTNQTGFADSLHVSQSNINKMVRGVKGVSRTVINGLLIVHKNVNVHWLLTGEGEMFLAQPGIVTERVEEGSAGYGKSGLLLGEVESVLKGHAREIQALQEQVAQLTEALASLKK